MDSRKRMCDNVKYQVEYSGVVYGSETMAYLYLNTYILGTAEHRIVRMFKI